MVITKAGTQLLNTALPCGVLQSCLEPTGAFHSVQKSEEISSLPLALAVLIVVITVASHVPGSSILLQGCSARA